MTEMENQKHQEVVEAVQAALRRHDVQLNDINKKIFDDPELAYEEFHAHDNICTLFTSLSADGYRVRPGGRTVVFCAEYDALPNMGHACGHNLIATSSIAAFIATCEAMRSCFPDSTDYTLRLLGTPAEEGGGGKVKLLNAGAYKSVDAALMVHPMPTSKELPFDGVAAIPPGDFLATRGFRITFTGKPSHAAMAPWEGINALDAAVSAYVNLSVLRQQLLPTQRLHGIITHGGDRANVIPPRAVMEYYIRSLDAESLQTLFERVKACFEAAATSTGCKVEYEDLHNYLDVKSNMPICEKYADAMKKVGRNVWVGGGNTLLSTGASTDMGNVSYAIPSFHGVFSVPGTAPNHTPEFTASAGNPEAYQRCIDCGAGMAVVACQILADDQFAASIKDDFKQNVPQPSS
ncbi:hypothetical protein N7510_000563 [Penicillium lagena]|uniref:uncharacterized protein n=1 Tax=Penicillium lagena TaxID=94218 RepID=UPI00253FB3D4|nr:uncharacterized protein N7510_000563 [Penicillium lagena]KAJ5624254.1 hypothetical protein N7510_000563 [Penicillium lagena]